jgi:integrase/recombinase XerD
MKAKHGNVSPKSREAANEYPLNRKMAGKSAGMIDKRQAFQVGHPGETGQLAPDDVGARVDEAAKTSPLPGPVPEFPEQNKMGETLKETARLIEQYLADNQPRLVGGTLRHHHYVLGRFFTYCQKECDQIGKADIRSFVDDLKRMGYKNATINSYLAVLKSFFNYCFEEELVAKNPALPFRRLAVGDPVLRFLVPDEHEQLREVASGCLLERAIVETFSATGVRASELCGIKKEDVNWDERTIAVREGWKHRIVFFNAACAARLKQYLGSRQDDSPYLFINRQGKPLTAATLDTYFHKFSRKLNFQVTPRMLRHTFAAGMARKGMSLEALCQFMGHRNIQSTMIYNKFYAANARNEYFKCQ